ncbi:MAG: 30S ribosomal protein S20 [Candidatus Melainabacteria bacterium]
MPNIKSAEKRVLVAERNRKRNVAFKSSMRTAIKKLLEAVKTSAEQKDQTTLLSEVYSLVDRGVLKGILKKNTGARYKARAAKALSAASA